MNTDSVVVRAAQIEDLAAIIDLDRQLFSYDAQFDDTLDHGWTDSDEGVEFFRDRIIAEDGFAAVAVHDGRTVGYLAGGLRETHSYRRIKTMAELECMFVVEQCRGLQVGRRLVAIFMDWCRARGIKRVMVEASAGNSGAIRFYKSQGFSEYNIILEQSLDPAGSGINIDIPEGRI